MEKIGRARNSVRGHSFSERKRRLGVCRLGEKSRLGVEYAALVRNAYSALFNQQRPLPLAIMWLFVISE